MLGLGNSAVHPPFDPLDLIGTYISDFASGTDGWGDFGITEGTQTKTANQSIGGRSGVLKVSYDADESVLFGIEKATPWGEDFKVGDHLHVSFDIYVVDEDPADGGASEIPFLFQAGDSYHASRRFRSTQTGAGHEDVWSPKHGTVVITGGTDDGNMRIGFSSADPAPGTGDHWYLDNVVVKHYRPK